RERDLVGLTVSGRVITADELAVDSAQSIINKFFKTSPDIVKGNPTVTYNFGQTQFDRIDATTTASTAFRKDKPLATTFSVDNRYRFYLNDVNERLIAARQTFETKLKCATVLIGRAEVAPYVNAFWLKLVHGGRTFRLFEYGVKFQIPVFASRGPGRAHK